MNAHVTYVKDRVVDVIQTAKSPEFDSEIVFVRMDGETHAYSLTQFAMMSGSEDVVGTYASVEEMIEVHNREQDVPIIGLVHTAHIGEEQDNPHLMVIALDDKGDSSMTLFPVEDNILGEPRNGTGFSPQLDPWAEAAGRGIKS